MPIEFEIFWSDLKPESQAQMVAAGFQVHDNIELAPLFILEQDPEDLEDYVETGTDDD